jgi:hypothetical protein
MTIREAIAVLDLQLPVSHDDVRKAFRRMAKLYHPDLQREEHLREQASKRFIAARQASEILLRKPEAVINAPESQRATDPIVRRERRPPPPPPKIVDAPLVKEFDNVMKLFQLLMGKKDGRKWMFRWTFSPTVLIGRWYEELIERHYPGEDRLSGVAFALFRFFRLLFGAIFLIAAFLLMSIAGLMAVVLFFPPAMVFYALYSIYHSALQTVAQKLNKQVKRGDISTWLSARREYLWYRTLPLGLFGLAAWGTISFGKTGTIYLESIAWLICLPILLLALSITYEWLHYRRILHRHKHQHA